MKRTLAGALAIIIMLAGIEPVTIMAAGDDNQVIKADDGEIFKVVDEAFEETKTRASVIDSGICGTDVTWTLDDEYTLLISGSGEMDDYEYETDRPWDDYEFDIKKIEIEYGITRIGDNAFKGLLSVRNVEWPSSVKEIGDHAFDMTFGNIESTITIPDNITSIGYAAFARNERVQGFEVDSSNKYYCSVDGHLLNKNKTYLYQAGNLRDTEISLPDTVTGVLDYAMAYGNYISFENDNIEYLFESALLYCDKLECVKLKSLKEVQKFAFQGCSSLKEITFPASLEVIGSHAFSGCTFLTDIIFRGNAPTFSGSNFFNEVTATASYYLTKTGWTDEVMQDYGGNITWKGLKSNNVITASNVEKVVKSSKRIIELGAKAKGNAKLSYKSNNSNITVNSKGVVTIKKNYIGKATITITAAATNKYKKATKKITITSKPVKATINSVKNNKKGIITIKAKKNIGNVKYQVQIAKNSEFKNKISKILSYKSDGWTANVDKGKTYYVRVRGYKKVNDVPYYGKWSDVKKITISK